LPAGTLKNQVYAARRVWAYFFPNFERPLTNGFVGKDPTAIGQNFSTSWKINVKLKYSRTAWLMLSDSDDRRREWYLANLSFLDNLTIQKKTREYQR
jgi:hypothetical protein